MLNNFYYSESGRDIPSRWHRLLQILEILRNYKHVSLVTSPSGSVPHNPIIDAILPSLLLLQFVSLFEDAAMQRILKMGWKFKKEKATLYNRIQLLSDNESVLDSSELHAIRLTRNDVAHNLKFIDWSYLVHSVDIIEKELQNWALIGSRPDYQFFVERSGMKEAEKEEFLFAMDYEVGIKLNDKKLWSYAWTTSFGSSSSE